jgi:hypothetical protein
MQSAPQGNFDNNASLENGNVVNGYTVETVTLSNEEFDRLFSGVGRQEAANDAKYESGPESEIRNIAELTNRMIA